MGAETLITGTASGLGKYLLSHEPGGVGLTRADAGSLLESLAARGVGTIIHCAFDRAPRASDENVALTERLLSLPHDRFVFLSSCDVYSRWPADESSPIDIDRVRTPTARAKALCEERVLRRARRPLILRATSLLGPFSKPSNLSRLLQDEKPQLTLTADSSWNIVLHEDVRQFLEKALRSGLTGTFNLAVSSLIRVDELASKLGKSPQYGEFKYEVGEVSNKKAAAVHDSLGMGSWENIQRFLSSRAR
ncbi:MAG TPA: NAD(P)-dependent oxidoreductase [Bdellovibrionota bacterium]|nr:NAD(P)-dependent oxidoreductase [Bdellovibrionota bacterium]